MPRAKGNQRRVQAKKAQILALFGEPASAIAKKLRVSRDEAFKLVASPLNRAPRLPKKWKSPSSPVEAREWLQAVADHLITWPNASSRFRFVGRRLKKYLRDPETLDIRKELGLVSPVGRPSSFKERMRRRERGRKIVQLKDAGRQWRMIGKEVGMKDKRSLKRIYDEYSPLLMKEKQLAEVDRAIMTFLKEEPLQRPKSS